MIESNNESNRKGKMIITKGGEREREREKGEQGRRGEGKKKGGSGWRGE